MVYNTSVAKNKTHEVFIVISFLIFPVNKNGYAL